MGDGGRAQRAALWPLALQGCLRIRNQKSSYPSMAHPTSVRVSAIQQSRFTNVNPTSRYRSAVRFLWKLRRARGCKDNSKTVVPVRSVGRRSGGRRDEIEVFRVLGGAAGPIVGAGQDEGIVDNHRLFVSDAGLLVYPDRHSGGHQQRYAAVATSRRRLVRYQPDVDAAFLCAGQRFDDARTRR